MIDTWGEKPKESRNIDKKLVYKRSSSVIKPHSRKLKNIYSGGPKLIKD